MSPSKRKFRWGIMRSTGIKRYIDPISGCKIWRTNRKCRIPIDLYPCKVEESMTMKKVGDQTIGVIQRRRIDKEGCCRIWHFYGQLKSYEKNYTTHDLELGAVRRWIELFSDYDCESHYHPVVASDESAGLHRGLDEMIERRSDGTLYYLNRMWVPLKGDVKAEHQRPFGLLQQPEIPEWKWESWDVFFHWLSFRLLLLVIQSSVRLGQFECLGIGYFKITERIGLVAYRLRLSEELNGVHDFHVSNLKKCLADPTLQVPLDEIQVDAKLNFVEEPVEILEREFKKLKQSRIAIVKVRWNSKCGPEFTWEREDQMRL
ncbi:hypothetical protein Tco_0143894, partial [Tanacetum coccineum]